MNNELFKHPMQLLVPAISFLPIFLIGIPLMGVSDTLSVFLWFVCLMVFAIIAYPLTTLIFQHHRSGGFFLSTIICWLLTGIVIWTIAYMGIPVFNLPGIIFVMVVIAAVSYGVKPIRESAIKKLKDPNTLIDITIEETVFAIVLTLLCFYKGMYPDINGQEKFMNYGFIMSMLRSSVLPANDMWLSGYSINYYYFGQYLYTILFKITGIATGTGYTISMCSAIAIPFALCYSIGTFLVDTAKVCGLRAGRAFTYIGGALAGLCTIIFGNSHSFFYDSDGLGNSFLKALQRKGFNVGRIDNFFYPDSTRFIGWNPDSSTIPGIQNGGDYTIEEFPFYSFLVGDLHAHVVSTMVVLVIMSVCIAALNKVARGSFGEAPSNIKNPLFTINSEARKGYLFTEIQKTITPEIIVCGVLLGCAQMTNYWDFLIYFIFCSMTLLVLMTTKSNAFSTIPGAVSFVFVVGSVLFGYLAVGSTPLFHIVIQLVIFSIAGILALNFPCTLSRTSFGMSFLFTVAHIIALPFNANFDMISNTLGKSVNHSPLFQLWILYGTHALVCVVFFVFTIVVKNHKYSVGKKGKKPSKAGELYNSNVDFANPIAKFFGERNLVDIFVCGMIVVGLLLIIAPEIFYVRDIYTGGYLRSNTMFKFHYAAFIMISIAMAYSIVRLFWVVNKKGNYSTPAFIFSIVFALMLFIPGHYTFAALNQRCGGDLSKENFKTLDGTDYIRDYSGSWNSVQYTGNMVSYMEAVNWFNDNVTGTPVICESYGDSYTDYNMVSAYTGLQTICGWQTHEWLWRFHGIVDEETDLLISDPQYDVWAMYLTPRHAAVDTIYTSNDINAIQAVIDEYSVEYIVLGDLERVKFGNDNSQLLSSCGEVVFVSGDLVVIRTHPASMAQ